MSTTLAPRLAEHPLIATVDELRLGDVSFYDLAEHFHDCRDFALLDSQTHDGGLGAYSFLAFDPFAHFTSKDGTNTVHGPDGVHACPGDPLEAMQHVFGAY